MKGVLFSLVLVLILSAYAFAEQGSETDSTVGFHAMAYRAGDMPHVYDGAAEWQKEIESRIKALEDAMWGEKKPALRLQHGDCWEE